MDGSTSPILWTQRHTLQKDTAYLKYVSHGGILDDMRKLLLRKWVMELPMGSVKKLKSMLDDNLQLQYIKP
jgi:hypothetical protein